MNEFLTTKNNLETLNPSVNAKKTHEIQYYIYIYTYIKSFSIFCHWICLQHTLVKYTRIYLSELVRQA